MGLLSRRRRRSTLTKALVPALALTPACYSPTVRDCTLRCDNLSDCTADQICGSDGYCAIPEVAGRCLIPSDAGSQPPDASMMRPDAQTPDASVPPTLDAGLPGPDLAPLHVTVDGQGRITVPSVGTCDSMAQGGNCTYSIEVPHQLTLEASPHMGWHLAKWTAGPCTGQTASSCAFTLTSATTVGAKFAKDGHGGGHGDGGGDD